MFLSPQIRFALSRDITLLMYVPTLCGFIQTYTYINLRKIYSNPFTSWRKLFLWKLIPFIKMINFVYGLSSFSVRSRVDRHGKFLEIFLNGNYGRVHPIFNSSEFNSFQKSNKYYACVTKFLQFNNLFSISHKFSMYIYIYNLYIFFYLYADN